MGGAGGGSASQKLPLSLRPLPPVGHHECPRVESLTFRSLARLGMRGGQGGGGDRKRRFAWS